MSSSTPLHVPHPFPTRNLGKNGPPVSAIGLGCMGMSFAYSGAQDDPHKVLEESLRLGCSFWDTADIYGDNEELLAKTLKDRRKEVFLCSKFANTPQGPNGKPEYVRSACEKSLHRLGVDHIDLYYMHRMDPNTPIEDTMNALVELKNEGKIKHIGLSECSAETLRRAHKIHPIAAVQIEFSPWTLDIEENGVLSTCRELGITIVAYSPLGRGFLTGKYKSIDDLAADDRRRFFPRFQGENFKKNLDLVAEIEKLAHHKGCSPAQLCLAWVLAQGEDFIPIPGTTSVKNLESNLASVDVKLTKDDLDQVRSIINKIPAEGTRYPTGMMSSLNK